MPKNKVKFNLKNVHWAKVTFSDTAPVFGPWNAWPGAVSISLDPQGDTTPFYADGIIYFQSAANNGYSGDFESALVPEDFRQEILKEKLDANGVFVERADTETEHFALGYQVDGDVQGDLCVLYNCTIARPGMGGQTTEGSKEPKTDTVTISATPLPGSTIVKARTSSKTSPSVYAAWWNEVYYTDSAQTATGLMSLEISDAELTPEFDTNTAVYTATTSAASGTITATPYGTAQASVTVNGVPIEPADSATWNEGANTVTIVAGDIAYVVTVTKE